MPGRFNIENFIQKAQTVHGLLYDYSNVYINNSAISIVCPKHEPFIQSPTQHLSGQGCSKCSGHKSHRITTQEFISKVKVIHGEILGIGGYFQKRDTLKYFVNELQDKERMERANNE